ncbi:MAG: hypothetical protein LC130_27505 [Bryobacterales bacterium]|nr:hypothetical protein [Bryobacterales bacterium]
MKTFGLACFALLATTAMPAQQETARLRVDLVSAQGPMEIERYGLGIGGFSPALAWDDRVHEIRALRPKLMRVFLQEYYRLMPAPGKYDFTLLDRQFDHIHSTGAEPFPCITFKPAALFPRIDNDLVEPTSWAGWEELVFRVVRRYKERGPRIRYWEITNEGDIRSGGGTPYHFTPESYVRFYKHTADAILRADPRARVGGPALTQGGVRPPHAMLSALLDFCQKTGTPLHFVSWHGYNNDPRFFGDSTKLVKKLLANYPSLKPETMITEWNLSLAAPPADRRFQPAFIAEATYLMKEAGLDYSMYYHIRDQYFEPQLFAPFYPKEDVVQQEFFWNYRPQQLGLFDVHNVVRPAYFLFKLLVRLTGERLAVDSTHPSVHALASRDARLKSYNLLFWNFSASPVRVTVELAGAAKDLSVMRQKLDATGPSDDDVHRLALVDTIKLPASRASATVELEPYGVLYWLVR